MFYAGATNSQEVIFSVILKKIILHTGSGAGSFKVDSTVSWIKSI